MTQDKRPLLKDLNLNFGKRTRLHRILYEHGPGNGMALILPIDHGLEHGPRDFFANPESLDPAYQLRLAKEGGFSAIVFHIGLAEKYMREFAGEVPLVLKLNGKTSIPPETHAFSPQTASVEDAVRLGADAVGYTLYVGSPAQDKDFIQFAKIREDAQRFGMPLIVWAYPRGEAIEAKGGRDSLYAVDYAARVANELGADMVKINIPEYDKAKSQLYPEPYKSLQLSTREALEKAIKSAGRTMVLISGGEKMGDEELLEKVRISFEAGAAGLVFGRNLWQRAFKNSLEIAERIKRLMMEF
ncbi:MAG: fructose-bisphosphate aldolase [Candidatus Bathyarchaeota archaeon]|nr:fructose-bisphosphate aldolase [Candidatus Bathyarchaeota archaeon]